MVTPEQAFQLFRALNATGQTEGPASSSENNSKSVIPRPTQAELERKYGVSSLEKRRRRPKGKKEMKGEWMTRRELDPNASYFPPKDYTLLLAEARLANYPFTLRLGFDTAITTDGSGANANVTSNSPVQAQNWTNMAAVFDEYRVLAFVVEYEPFWTVNITFTPIASVIDRSDVTALTGYGLAERYESMKKVAGQKKWTQKWFMTETAESGFVSTASPAANGWIKMYTSGNTASQTIGRLNVQLLVQFRGLGIN